MTWMLFIIPALVATAILVLAAVAGSEDLRRLCMSIVLLLWALIRWPFEAVWGLFRR